jgi:hypothetical protein
MSLTSDPEVDAAIASASGAGMESPELRTWRLHLGAKALDICGCRASAKAAAVVGVLVGLLVVAMAGPTAALAWGIATGFAAAIVGKVIGQRAAERRRALLLDTLRDRVAELQASQA